MKFNIFSNLNNGAGLQKDWELLRGILQNYGHEVIGVDYNRWRFQPNKVDVNIFLEIIEPAMLAQSVAHRNWLIPNSEWWGANWDQFLHRFDWILCKTKDCFDIWSRKVGRQKCKYIGWEARDMFDASVKREMTFLHLAGKSETKNTAAVCEAWEKFKLPYPLTVSAFKDSIVRLCYYPNGQPIPNVRQINRFTDSQVVKELNRHTFHIMPSKYEGYGHAIHEALSCGGIVITTNAPPMNQFKGIPYELTIPISSRVPRGPTVFNIVTAQSVAEKVSQAARLGQGRVEELRRQARAGFNDEREFFRMAIDGVIREANI